MHLSYRLGTVGSSMARNEALPGAKQFEALRVQDEMYFESASVTRLFPGLAWREPILSHNRHHLGS